MKINYTCNNCFNEVSVVPLCQLDSTKTHEFYKCVCPHCAHIPDKGISTVSVDKRLIPNQLLLNFDQPSLN